MIIYEKVYGNMATVFHRTSISNLVNKVYTEGFKPGKGDTYGKGFYSTYELDSQISSSMEKTYGNIIVKFTVPISTFFVFDYEEFKKSPNFKKLGSPNKDNFLKVQFKFFKMDDSKFDYEDSPAYSSDTAMECVYFIPSFRKLCEGIIFTGKQDGKVLCSYNTKLIYPLSYSVDDGKTWEKVEKNLDYLKKVSKVKAQFIPDLTVYPEDFSINDYDFDKDGFLNVHSKFTRISDTDLKELPFKFGVVDGSFFCVNNKLTSLKNSPRKVGGTFDCSANHLTSLEGGPTNVQDHYDCSYNKITSLEGAPIAINKNFICSNNNLYSLKGAPQLVAGNIICKYNRGSKHLTKNDYPGLISGDFISN